MSTLLDRHDVLLVDLDGTLYRGATVVPGAVAAVQAARDRGVSTVYVTNNASRRPAEVAAQARVRELQDKLRLLESRALALEGTYTRLPADQMVIQQIEQAGVATLQETATTVASR
ncbi:MAG: HAD family hydrolase, partial [Pseudonocardia sp.]|nr:HAD family hydrolase [Pseudonocardia sp.]